MKEKKHFALIGTIFLVLLALILIGDNAIKLKKMVIICDDQRRQKACKTEQLPYRDKNLVIEERINDLLNRMTITEKIGQLMLVEKNSIEDIEDIARYGIGAILSGSGGNPEENTPDGWFSMVSDFYKMSSKTRLAIPILYGVDAIHGNGNLPAATVFPHAIGLGAANNSALAEKIGLATAKEIAAINVFWNFAPNLDVVQDIRWGRTYETFGTNTQRASDLGAAFLKGLQSATSTADVKVIGTAKHYIGGGAAKWGSSRKENYEIDQGSAKISEHELRQQHLPPFIAAIKNGALVVMAAHNKWWDQDLVTSDYLLQTVLKGELAFKGFVVSDWHGVHEIWGSDYGTTVEAINSGVDMIMLPYDYKSFSKDMHLAISKGDISKERLDDAVARILRVKFSMGLFDAAFLTEKNFNTIGSQEHRNLARQAVRESLVLLKNTKNTLPIPLTTQTILVAGSAAHNYGMQAGGWTVEWQGLEDGLWIEGTKTILQGIMQHAPQQTKIIYDRFAQPPDKTKIEIGIAVVGEKPYAEGEGDNEHPRLSDEDLKTIEKLRNISEHLIIIVISGRPLEIKEYINLWDAVIAAWLPGSEGDGVAEVLFGKYPFTGTLPVSWDLQ